eukprot:RCo006615
MSCLLRLLCCKGSLCDGEDTADGLTSVQRLQDLTHCAPAVETQHSSPDRGSPRRTDCATQTEAPYPPVSQSSCSSLGPTEGTGVSVSPKGALGSSCREVAANGNGKVDPVRSPALRPSSVTGSGSSGVVQPYRISSNILVMTQDGQGKMHQMTQLPFNNHKASVRLLSTSSDIDEAEEEHQRAEPLTLSSRAILDGLTGSFI